MKLYISSYLLGVWFGMLCSNQMHDNKLHSLWHYKVFLYNHTCFCYKINIMSTMYLFWSLVVVYEGTDHLRQSHRMLTHHFTEGPIDLGRGWLQRLAEEGGKTMEVLSRH